MTQARTRSETSNLTAQTETKTIKTFVARLQTRAETMSMGRIPEQLGATSSSTELVQSNRRLLTQWRWSKVRLLKKKMIALIYLEEERRQVIPVLINFIGSRTSSFERWKSLMSSTTTLTMMFKHWQWTHLLKSRRWMCSRKRSLKLLKFQHSSTHQWRMYSTLFSKGIRRVSLDFYSRRESRIK
jgi:hypothetical protein